jgi:hypothetical protein
MSYKLKNPCYYKNSEINHPGFVPKVIFKKQNVPSKALQKHDQPILQESLK